MEKYLDYTEEVAQAIAAGKPVVALESTIISHGMPYPQNLETAKILEKEIRDLNAVPATIAILNGKIHIGLDEKQLELLATSDEVTKVSRRDLPTVIAAGKHGATTVAATMICAELAGIHVFATGGIGGVHRGGQDSLDVSADLLELARTKVAVVSAGVKSILDIGRTLEYLETHGVPVIGYGCDAFPAFYTRESGYGVDVRLDTAKEIADLLSVKWELGLDGGAIIANPVPEADAMEAAKVETAIQQALTEADEKSICGKEITPFLLKRVKEITGGESLQTNIALVRNNARLAANIAVALAQPHSFDIIDGLG